MQLRYLQTLNGIATEQNSTIVFPLPVDLFSLFQKCQVNTTNAFAFKPSTKSDQNITTTTETLISTPTATNI